MCMNKIRFFVGKDIHNKHLHNPSLSIKSKAPTVCPLATTSSFSWIPQKKVPKNNHCFVTFLLV